MSKKQQWVRIGEAARATGIPARTLLRWAKQGRIRCLQPGGLRTWFYIHVPSLGIPPPADQPRTRSKRAQ